MALLLLLTYKMARTWNLDRGSALLAVLFLATSPGRVAFSNFGTADVTAVFYFYLTLVVAGKYLNSKDQLWFVLAATLTGAAIAIKFFIPLLVPLFLLVVVHRGRTLVSQALTALLVAIGSFEAVSLFAYAPWDFANLLAMLKTDNLTIASGNGPIRQLVLYGWDSVSAISIPVFLLVMIGSIAMMLPVWRQVRIEVANRLEDKDWRSLITPQTLLAGGLLAHAFLILGAGVHASRHLLVFFPSPAYSPPQPWQD